MTEGHYFDPEHRGEDPRILSLALKLALDRCGQTTPVGDYDIDRAREIVTGEVNEIRRLREQLKSAEARAKALEEALTPSGDTKAAYGDKCHMGVTLRLRGQEEYRNVQIPWEAIRDVMAMIRTRAAVRSGEKAG